MIPMKNWVLNEADSLAVHPQTIRNRMRAGTIPMPPHKKINARVILAQNNSPKQMTNSERLIAVKLDSGVASQLAGDLIKTLMQERREKTTPIETAILVQCERRLAAAHAAAFALVQQTKGESPEALAP